MAFARDALEGKRVAHDDNRIVAVEVERNELGAGRIYIGDQPAGRRGNDDAVAAFAQNARQRRGAEIGGADIESGRDNEHAGRIVHRRRQSTRHDVKPFPAAAGRTEMSAARIDYSSRAKSDV